jgi:alkylation response protein AidB-like acyl-CoA dehydrogenase
MEFAFTEEQLMIRDTAEAFLSQVSTSAATRAAMATELGYDPLLWKKISGDMCWQAMHLPEDCGGLGLSYVALAATMEQMGRFLLCSPFFSTVCLAANTVLLAGSAAQKERYLGAIASGETTATLAYTGNSGRWDLSSVEAVWRRTEQGYELNGSYRYVPDGHSADLLILAARAERSAGDSGIRLFAVPADSPGVSRKLLPTMDQTRKQASIELSAVMVADDQRLGEADVEAAETLARAIDLATVCLAAEQVGGAQQALDSAVAYTGERVQFNRTIASFQAVKHKAADMMLKVDTARSAAYYAACVAQETLEGGPLTGELAEAASIAKAYCSDAYYFCAGSALQLFGGVGFTWEYDIQLYFKRAKSSETLLGNASYHRERIAALLLD